MALGCIKPCFTFSFHRFHQNKVYSLTHYGRNCHKTHNTSQHNSWSWTLNSNRDFLLLSTFENVLVQSFCFWVLLRTCVPYVSLGELPLDHRCVCCVCCVCVCACVCVYIYREMCWVVVLRLVTSTPYRYIYIHIHVHIHVHVHVHTLTPCIHIHIHIYTDISHRFHQSRRDLKVAILEDVEAGMYAVVTRACRQGGGLTTWAVSSAC